MSNGMVAEWSKRTSTVLVIGNDFTVVVRFSALATYILLIHFFLICIILIIFITLIDLLFLFYLIICLLSKYI